MDMDLPDFRYRPVRAPICTLVCWGEGPNRPGVIFPAHSTHSGHVLLVLA